MISQAPWNVIFGIMAGLSPWLAVGYGILLYQLKKKAKRVRLASR